MIHIVFQEADIQVLQQAIQLDDRLAGPVEIIRDDYAAGPVENIYETEGYQARRDWWKGLLEASPYDSEQLMNMVDDRLTVHQLKKSLDENEKELLWIWMGQNSHDVCGYFWLMSQFREYQGRVFVLYLNNLPFINEKGQIFYPTTLHQIQPKEFLKASKLNRAITLSEFEVDPDEWNRLCNENAMVRVLEGGKKIASQDADFYDKEILSNLGNEWQKGNRAIGNILGKMKIKTGDVFVLWRMKQLAEEGKLEINGDPSRGWKEFEIKLKAKEEPASVNLENP
jgi:hypothetical protein